jgi:hypothetical protein
MGWQRHTALWHCTAAVAVLAADTGCASGGALIPTAPKILPARPPSGVRIE